MNARARLASLDQLDRDLKRWSGIGLLEPAQAEAIVRYEFDIAEPSEPADSGGAVAEMLAYAGTVVALAGVGFLYGTAYATLGAAGRFAIPLLVALAALAAGAMLHRGAANSQPLRRARSAALALCAVALGIATAQAQIELLGGPMAVTDPQTAARIGAIAALVTAAAAAIALGWTGAGLPALVLGGAATAATSLLLHLAALPPWPNEMVWIVTGGVLAAGAAVSSSRRWRAATEILAFTSLMAPILGGLMVPDGNLPLELLAGTIALAGFAAAAARASGGYAVAAGVGLFAFVLDMDIRYFSQSLGFAAVLISSGVALFGIAVVLVRLLPTLPRRAA